jgi:hypothetical protein
MWLPHTATIAIPSDGGTGTETGGVVYGTPATIRCNIQPMSVDQMVGDWGPELDADYQIFANLPDVPKFVKRSRVVRGGKVYEVVAPPKIYDQGLPTDHMVAAMKEKQIAETA